MKTYQELISDLKILDERIEAARQAESAAALARVRELVSTFGFTSAQVFPLPGAGRSKFKPKYKDPATGALWSGIGKAPKWIAGKDRSEFEIVTEKPVFSRTEQGDPKNPFPVQ